MRAVVCLAAVLTAAVSASLGQDKTQDVTLREVKYDGLKDVILKNRGKVVYVDFWNNL